MNNHNNRFYSTFEAITTSILGVFSGYIIHEITLEKSDLWLAIIGAIVLILLVEKSLIWLLTSIVDRSITLRKLIYSGHYIEGNWISAIYTLNENNSEKELFCYSVLAINVEENEYKVNGTIIDKDCRKITGTFGSAYTEYNRKKKKFIYHFTGKNLNPRRKNVNSEKQEEIFGKVELNRSQEQAKTKNPIQFMGSIDDTKNQNTRSIVSIRVNDDIHKNDLIDLEKIKLLVSKNESNLCLE